MNLLIRLNVIDVCLSAKIRILKQITTERRRKFEMIKMFVLAQRYEF